MSFAHHREFDSAMAEVAIAEGSSRRLSGRRSQVWDDKRFGLA
jgi:hypothetical protein